MSIITQIISGERFSCSQTKVKTAIPNFLATATKESAGIVNDLGVRLIKGSPHLTPDPKLAESCLQKAGELGSHVAWLNLGQFFEGKEQIDKAEEAYQKSSDGGNPVAAFRLGVLLTGKDQDGSLTQFTLAAEKNHRQAQEVLGNLYCAAEEYQESAKWFAKAAGQGSVNAIVQLAYLILSKDVEGIERNVLRGITYLTAAAEKEHIGAILDLAKTYLVGYDDIIPRDEAQGIKYLNQAFILGDAEGTFRLGCCHYQGIGVPENTTKGEKILRKAAEKGHRKALFIIGYLDKNTKLMVQAKELGDPLAIAYLRHPEMMDGGTFAIDF